MTAKQTDTRNDQYGGLTKIRTKATGFFRVERIGGRWWLITPDGNGFISIGMSHFDLTVLKYPDDIHVWKTQDGGSEEQYLRQGVAQPLREWRGNTIGWTEEMVAGEWMNADTLNSPFARVAASSVSGSGYALLP